MDIKFEDIPRILASLCGKVDAVYECIQNLSMPIVSTEAKTWLSVNELCTFLPSHPRKQTVYSWTSKKQIPFHKKGRSIMFDKAEIEAWLRDSDHVKCEADLMREAEAFVKSKSK